MKYKRPIALFLTMILLIQTIGISRPIDHKLADRTQVDPVTLGLAFIAIKNIIASLETLSRNVNNDLRETVNSSLSNARSFVADAEIRYRSSLDLTLDRLHGETLEIYNRAKTLLSSLDEMQRNFSSISADVLTNGDIAAYNALYSLPGRNRIPRVLTVKPKYFRIGTGTPLITIFGNFLDFDKANLNLKLNGSLVNDADIIGLSSNSIEIKIPENLLSENNQESIISVSLTPSWQRAGGIFRKTKIKKGKEIRISFTIAPRRYVKYDLKIIPRLSIPIYKDFNWQLNNTSEDCADYKRESTVCVDPGWDAIDGSVVVTSANRNNDQATSRIVGNYREGNCYKVKYELNSCHGFLGFCCGTAWCNFYVTMKAKNIHQPKIDWSEFADAGTIDAVASKTWNYKDKNVLPPEFNDLDWDYILNVTVIEPGRPDKTFSVSKGSPTSAQGIDSSITTSGILTVNFSFTTMVR